jgi:hypothetical protein
METGREMLFHTQSRRAWALVKLTFGVARPSPRLPIRLPALPDHRQARVSEILCLDRRIRNVMLVCHPTRTKSPPVLTRTDGYVGQAHTDLDVWHSAVAVAYVNRSHGVAAG